MQSVRIIIPPNAASEVLHRYPSKSCIFGELTEPLRLKIHETDPKSVCSHRLAAHLRDYGAFLASIEHDTRCRHDDAIS